MTLYLNQYLIPLNFYNNHYTSFSYFYCSEKLTVSLIFSILDIFYILIFYVHDIVSNSKSNSFKIFITIPLLLFFYSTPLRG